MNFKRLLLAAILCAAAAFSTAQADEASVKTAFEAAMRTTVESVTKTPYLGLYEVYASGQILYTDENVTAVFAGNLLDTKSMQNVTAERMKKLSAVKISDLPLDKAVKMVKGDGSRVLVTFEDPNCGYCKRIAKDLNELKNVTIYTFIYPILSPDSADKARKVWCSTDRPKAWRDLMVDGKTPTAKGECDTPIQDVLQLGRKYSVTGTPTLIFSNGERVPGAVGLAEIEKRLAPATSSK